jgi:hypothetical protein
VAGRSSSRNPGAIPPPYLLKARCQALTLMESLLCADPELRFHAVHPQWAEHATFAEMNDREGNYWYAWFSPAGALLWGADHDCPMSPWRRDPPSLWPGLLDGVPSELADHTATPPLDHDALTFCLWSTPESPQWRHGRIAFPRSAAWAESWNDDPDGSGHLLALVTGTAEVIARYARDTWGILLDAEAADRLLQGAPADEALVGALFRRTDPMEALRAAAGLGLPVIWPDRTG